MAHNGKYRPVFAQCVPYVDKCRHFHDPPPPLVSTQFVYAPLLILKISLLFFSFKSACPRDCLNGDETDFANIGIDSCTADTCICKTGYSGTTCETCDLGYVDVDPSAIVECQSTILGIFRQLCINIVTYLYCFQVCVVLVKLEDMVFLSVQVILNFFIHIYQPPSKKFQT